MRGPARPPTRLLAGGLAALVLLLAATAWVGWIEAPRLRTPLGPVSLPDLASVAVAMAAGGFVARDGFRGLAVLLVALAGISATAAAWALAPEALPDAGRWLLRQHAFGLLLELATAWLAAHAGQRAAGRARPALRG